LFFLHWSAGHYGQPSPKYHLNIDHDGVIYASTNDLAEVLAHTWQRNSGSVGITLLCAYNATPEDLGPEPPTDTQIEVMVQVIAGLCDGLGLQVDFTHVRIHAEQSWRQ
jgi:hypothetical protein